MRKRYFAIIILLFYSIYYYFFINVNHDEISGNYISYTQYERIRSNFKEFDLPPDAYESDKYQLFTLNDRLNDSRINLNYFSHETNLIFDSIQIQNNTIQDLESYYSRLQNIYLDFEAELRIIKILKSDLQALNGYINKYERGSFSVRLYNIEIDQLYLEINSLDSIANYEKIDTSTVMLISNVHKIEQIKQKELEYLAQLELRKQEERWEQEKVIANRNNSVTFESLRLREKFYSDNHHISTSSINRNNFNVSNQTTVNYNSSSNTQNYNPNAAYPVVEVKGYYKSNGTYVKPHVRTAPNSTILDNLRLP